MTSVVFTVAVLVAYPITAFAAPRYQRRSKPVPHVRPQPAYKLAPSDRW